MAAWPAAGPATEPDEGRGGTGAAAGRAVAVRGADGRVAVVQSGNDAFAGRAWLAADGDARGPEGATLGNGIRCDAAGCVGKLRDGTLVAIANSIEAFQEDCRRA